ncbi:MAG TPA: lysine--tRNA ligase [Desulfonatronum sp.]|nr:lysine--tRNA ligase [Desulfonatronum sp.]
MAGNHANFWGNTLNAEQTQNLSQLQKQRLEKFIQLKNAGMSLYPNSFQKNTDIAAITTEYDHWDEDGLKGLNQTFAMAGRIMSQRSFGKVAFLHIQDATEQIQVFVQRDAIGSEKYALFKKMDIGDIVGVIGGLFRTKTGELTVKADTVELVSKSLRPLPEKYHGLKDVEVRYRQRYVDLMVNPRTREIFQRRTKIVRLLRHFLDKQGFMEVETPMMQPIPGGATAKPFITHHKALDMKLYMRIAPELYLKRLLVGGFEKIYEINRNFRNEGISTQHNPEFTMLEFYWAYATYQDLMSLTESMFAFLAREITGSEQIIYQGSEINLGGAWQRLSFFESLERVGGLNQEQYRDPDQARKLVLKLGENVQVNEKIGKIQAKLFDLLVEPKLIQPHFIYHYPTDISPLSRRNEQDPEVTDRFELFIAGREMANAFSELNDPMDQRGRFEEQVKEKEAGDEEAHFMDEDYIRALEYGMPPAAGEGVGVDRLAMLLTDSPSIREVILFPLLRPEVNPGL